MTNNKNTIADNFHDYSEESSEAPLLEGPENQVRTPNDYPQIDLTDAHDPGWRIQFTDVLQWIVCLIVVWLLYVTISFAYNLIERGREKLPSGEAIETILDDTINRQAEWQLSEKLAKLNRTSKAVVEDQKEKSVGIIESIREFFRNLFRRPNRSPIEIIPNIDRTSPLPRNQKQDKEVPAKSKHSVYDMIERF